MSVYAPETERLLRGCSQEDGESTSTARKYDKTRNKCSAGIKSTFRKLKNRSKKVFSFVRVPPWSRKGAAVKGKGGDKYARPKTSGSQFGLLPEIPQDSPITPTLTRRPFWERQQRRKRLSWLGGDSIRISGRSSSSRRKGLSSRFMEHSTCSHSMMRSPEGTPTRSGRCKRHESTQLNGVMPAVTTSARLAASTPKMSSETHRSWPFSGRASSATDTNHSTESEQAWVAAYLASNPNASYASIAHDERAQAVPGRFVSGQAKLVRVKSRPMSSPPLLAVAEQQATARRFRLNHSPAPPLSHQGAPLTRVTSPGSKSLNDHILVRPRRDLSAGKVKRHARGHSHQSTSSQNSHSKRTCPDLPQNRSRSRTLPNDYAQGEFRDQLLDRLKRAQPSGIYLDELGTSPLTLKTSDLDDNASRVSQGGSDVSLGWFPEVSPSHCGPGRSLASGKTLHRPRAVLQGTSTTTISEDVDEEEIDGVLDYYRNSVGLESSSRKLIDPATLSEMSSLPDEPARSSVDFKLTRRWKGKGKQVNAH